MTYDLIFEFEGDGEVSGRALTSLYRWLREDPTVDGDTRVRLLAAAEPGRPTGAADLLCAALTQTTGIGSLVVSFATWRDSRATPPPGRIRFGGGAVDSTAASAEELSAALRRLAAEPPPPPVVPPAASCTVPRRPPESRPFTSTGRRSRRAGGVA